MNQNEFTKEPETILDISVWVVQYPVYGGVYKQVPTLGGAHLPSASVRDDGDL